MSVATDLGHDAFEGGPRVLLEVRKTQHAANMLEE